MEEESKFNKPELPITKELMEQFRMRMREIDARPIKKVAEAQARKKKRMHQRMENLRKKAQMLSENPDMSMGMKRAEMDKLIRKAKGADKRPNATVTTRKQGGGKAKLEGKG